MRFPIIITRIQRIVTHFSKRFPKQQI
ncbi:unnamed protein product, partial [Rotaria sp. Silwood1]